MMSGVLGKGGSLFGNGYQQMSDSDESFGSEADGSDFGPVGSSPDAAAALFAGQYDDDAAAPSLLDKAKSAVKRAKKYKDYSEASAGSTTTGKVLNAVAKGASAVDKVATAAFPPAAVVTSPLSTAAGLAKNAHQAYHANDLRTSGGMQPLLSAGTSSSDGQ